jgi:hypothetical protein
MQQQHQTMTNNTITNTNMTPSTSPMRIYAYGFGDSGTTDKSVFSLFDQSYWDHQQQQQHQSVSINSDMQYVDSFEEVLNR